MGGQLTKPQSEMEKSVRDAVVALVEGLTPGQLEGVTVDAVLRHRAFRDHADITRIALDKTVECKTSEEEADFAMRAHIAAMISLHSHQLALSTLLDVLGHIPVVPERTSN